MKNRLKTTAAAFLCMSSLAGCGVGGGTGSVRPVIQPQQTRTASLNATSKSGANHTDGVANTASAGGGSGSDTTSMPDVYAGTKKAPKITTWDMSHYHEIATKRMVPEISRVPQGEVALTIDDGPSPYTEDIIHILNQYHVHATFFFVGRNVEHRQGVVKLAAESGDEIGDHTMSHPNLFDVTPEEQQQQINADRALIEQVTGKPVVLFRPPYENFNNATEQILKQDGMTIALWNRDPRDWSATNAEQIVTGVVDSSPSGGVFDLHDKELTLEALPDIIKGLEAKHLQMVVLPTSANG